MFPKCTMCVHSNTKVLRDLFASFLSLSLTLCLYLSLFQIITSLIISLYMDFFLFTHVKNTYKKSGKIYFTRLKLFITEYKFNNLINSPFSCEFKTLNGSIQRSIFHQYNLTIDQWWLFLIYSNSLTSFFLEKKKKLLPINLYYALSLRK